MRYKAAKYCSKRIYKTEKEEGERKVLNLIAVCRCFTDGFSEGYPEESGYE